MPSVPVYDVGGRQRTNAMREVNPSPDVMGASIGRALVSAGGNIRDLGAAFKEEEQKQDATAVMDAYTQGTKRLRDAQFDPENGLYTKQGKDAVDITARTEQTSQTIFSEISDGLKTPEQKEEFKRMWQRKSESAIDGAANYEFDQAKAVRKETKTSALANLQDDAVENYNNPKALAANFDAARAMIRANPDGLSAEGVTRLEREGISSLHTSVVQRLVQDSPGKALDYYEAHKNEIEGTDHATINGWIKGVSNIRDAKTAVDEIKNSGPAISIYNAVEKVESNGIADAEGFRADADGQRAQGLMQLMPDTAREAALSMGLKDVAALNDKDLGEFFSTAAGQKVNRKIGAFYLNKQLVANKGDLEAALIAYNAGPANASKFLNGDRDYSVLPKGAETYSYVKKVMGAYLGVDLSHAKEDDGSRGIQDAVNPKQPGARYRGDSQEFLLSKLAKGKDTEHITAMQPIMRDSLAAMMNAAPDNVKEGLGILSGTRTVERQQQLWNAAVKKYGSAEKARKWVAPPGKSQHNHGNAADLSWNGDYFSKAPADVQKWVHDNSARFGLTFPLPNEAWHIETEDARSGKKTSRFATVDIDPARMAASEDAPGTVVSDGIGPSPASIYTNVTQPYTVGQQKSDINDWMQAAEDRYADDPAKLAEVQRQLKQDYDRSAYEQKTAVEQKQMELYAKVIAGQSVADMDRNDLLAVGEDNVGKLMTIEDKFAKRNNPDETDPEAYVRLSRMSPEELRDTNLVKDYGHLLSKGDLLKWADKQAAATRPATRDQASAGMRTRTQIVSSTVDMLGLNPKPGTADAKSVAMLDRALDERIAAFAVEKGVAPDATEIQKMVDGLVMEGTVKGSGWISDDTKRVFELTPEEKGQFYPGDDDQYAGSYGDIPVEREQAVANVFAKIYPGLDAKGANEEGKVTLYNDMLRIEQGAAPTPPDDLAPQIRQAYAKKYGVAPDAAQLADIYRRMILKSVGR